MTSRDTNSKHESLGHIAHGQDLHDDSHHDSEEHSDASSNREHVINELFSEKDDVISKARHGEKIYLYLDDNDHKLHIDNYTPNKRIKPRFGEKIEGSSDHVMKTKSLNTREHRKDNLGNLARFIPDANSRVYELEIDAGLPTEKAAVGVQLIPYEKFLAQGDFINALLFPGILPDTYEGAQLRDLQDSDGSITLEGTKYMPLTSYVFPDASGTFKYENHEESLEKPSFNVNLSALGQVSFSSSSSSFKEEYSRIVGGYGSSALEEYLSICDLNTPSSVESIDFSGITLNYETNLSGLKTLLFGGFNGNNEVIKGSYDENSIYYGHQFESAELNDNLFNPSSSTFEGGGIPTWGRQMVYNPANYGLGESSSRSVLYRMMHWQTYRQSAFFPEISLDRNHTKLDYENLYLDNQESNRVYGLSNIDLEYPFKPSSIGDFTIYKNGGIYDQTYPFHEFDPRLVVAPGESQVIRDVSASSFFLALTRINDYTEFVLPYSRKWQEEQLGNGRYVNTDCYTDKEIDETDVVRPWVQREYFKLLNFPRLHEFDYGLNAGTYPPWYYGQDYIYRNAWGNISATYEEIDASKNARIQDFWGPYNGPNSRKSNPNYVNDADDPNIYPYGTNVAPFNGNYNTQNPIFRYDQKEKYPDDPWFFGPMGKFLSYYYFPNNNVSALKSNVDLFKYSVFDNSGNLKSDKSELWQQNFWEAMRVKDIQDNSGISNYVSYIPPDYNWEYWFYNSATSAEPKAGPWSVGNQTNTYWHITNARWCPLYTLLHTGGNSLGYGDTTIDSYSFTTNTIQEQYVNQLNNQTTNSTFARNNLLLENTNDVNTTTETNFVQRNQQMDIENSVLANSAYALQKYKEFDEMQNKLKIANKNDFTIPGYMLFGSNNNSLADISYNALSQTNTSTTLQNTNTNSWRLYDVSSSYTTDSSVGKIFGPIEVIDYYQHYYHEVGAAFPYEIQTALTAMQAVTGSAEGYQNKYCPKFNTPVMDTRAIGGRGLFLSPSWESVFDYSFVCATYYKGFIWDVSYNNRHLFYNGGLESRPDYIEYFKYHPQDYKKSIMWQPMGNKLWRYPSHNRSVYNNSKLVDYAHHFRSDCSFIRTQDYDSVIDADVGRSVNFVDHRIKWHGNERKISGGIDVNDIDGNGTKFYPWSAWNLDPNAGYNDRENNGWYGGPGDGGEQRYNFDAEDGGSQQLLQYNYIEGVDSSDTKAHQWASTYCRGNTNDFSNVWVDLSFSYRHQSRLNFAPDASWNGLGENYPHLGHNELTINTDMSALVHNAIFEGKLLWMTDQMVEYQNDGRSETQYRSFLTDPSDGIGFDVYYANKTYSSDANANALGDSGPNYDGRSTYYLYGFHHHWMNHLDASAIERGLEAYDTIYIQPYFLDSSGNPDKNRPNPDFNYNQHLVGDFIDYATIHHVVKEAAYLTYRAFYPLQRLDNNHLLICSYSDQNRSNAHPNPFGRLNKKHFDLRKTPKRRLFDPSYSSHNPNRRDYFTTNGKLQQCADPSFMVFQDRAPVWADNIYMRLYKLTDNPNSNLSKLKPENAFPYMVNDGLPSNHPDSSSKNYKILNHLQLGIQAARETYTQNILQKEVHHLTGVVYDISGIALDPSFEYIKYPGTDGRATTHPRTGEQLGPYHTGSWDWKSEIKDQNDGVTLFPWDFTLAFFGIVSKPTTRSQFQRYLVTHPGHFYDNETSYTPSMPASSTGHTPPLSDLNGLNIEISSETLTIDYDLDGSGAIYNINNIDTSSLIINNLLPNDLERRIFLETGFKQPWLDGSMCSERHIMDLKRNHSWCPTLGLTDLSYCKYTKSMPFPVTEFMLDYYTGDPSGLSVVNEIDNNIYDTTDFWTAWNLYREFSGIGGPFNIGLRMAYEEISTGEFFQGLTPGGFSRWHSGWTETYTKNPMYLTEENNGLDAYGYPRELKNGGGNLDGEIAGVQGPGGSRMWSEGYNVWNITNEGNSMTSIRNIVPEHFIVPNDSASETLTDTSRYPSNSVIEKKAPLWWRQFFGELGHYPCWEPSYMGAVAYNNGATENEVAEIVKREAVNRYAMYNPPNKFSFTISGLVKFVDASIQDMFTEWRNYYLDASNLNNPAKVLPDLSNMIPIASFNPNSDSSFAYDPSSTGMLITEASLNWLKDSSWYMPYTYATAKVIGMDSSQDFKYPTYTKHIHDPLTNRNLAQMYTDSYNYTGYLYDTRNLSDYNFYDSTDPSYVELPRIRPMRTLDDASHTFLFSGSQLTSPSSDFFVGLDNASLYTDASLYVADFEGGYIEIKQDDGTGGAMGKLETPFANLIVRKLYEYHWVESDPNNNSNITNNFGETTLTHSNWNLTGRRISFVDASNEGMFAPLYIENRSSNPITRSTPTNILSAGINQSNTDRLTGSFLINSDIRSEDGVYGLYGHRDEGDVSFALGPYGFSSRILEVDYSNNPHVTAWESSNAASATEDLLYIPPGTPMDKRQGIKNIRNYLESDANVATRLGKVFTRKRIMSGNFFDVDTEISDWWFEKYPYWNQQPPMEDWMAGINPDPTIYTSERIYWNAYEDLPELAKIWYQQNNGHFVPFPSRFKRYMSQACSESTGLPLYQRFTAEDNSDLEYHATGSPFGFRLNYPVGKGPENSCVMENTAWSRWSIRQWNSPDNVIYNPNWISFPRETDPSLVELRAFLADQMEYNTDLSMNWSSSGSSSIYDWHGGEGGHKGWFPKEGAIVTDYASLDRYIDASGYSDFWAVITGKDLLPFSLYNGRAWGYISHVRKSVAGGYTRYFDEQDRIYPGDPLYPKPAGEEGIDYSLNRYEDPSYGQAFQTTDLPCCWIEVYEAQNRNQKWWATRFGRGPNGEDGRYLKSRDASGVVNLGPDGEVLSDASSRLFYPKEVWGGKWKKLKPNDGYEDTKEYLNRVYGTYQSREKDENGNYVEVTRYAVPEAYKSTTGDLRYKSNDMGIPLGYLNDPTSSESDWEENEAPSFESVGRDIFQKPTYMPARRPANNFTGMRPSGTWVKNPNFDPDEEVVNDGGYLTSFGDNRKNRQFLISPSGPNDLQSWETFVPFLDEDTLDLEFNDMHPLYQDSSNQGITRFRHPGNPVFKSGKFYYLGKRDCGYKEILKRWDKLSNDQIAYLKTKMLRYVFSLQNNARLNYFTKRGGSLDSEGNVVPKAYFGYWLDDKNDSNKLHVKELLKTVLWGGMVPIPDYAWMGVAENYSLQEDILTGGVYQGSAATRYNQHLWGSILGLNHMGIPNVDAQIPLYDYQLGLESSDPITGLKFRRVYQDPDVGWDIIPPVDWDASYLTHPNDPNLPISIHVDGSGNPIPAHYYDANKLYGKHYTMYHQSDLMDLYYKPGNTGFRVTTDVSRVMVIGTNPGYAGWARCFNIDDPSNVALFGVSSNDLGGNLDIVNAQNYAEQVVDADGRPVLIDDASSSEVAQNFGASIPSHLCYSSKAGIYAPNAGPYPTRAFSGLVAWANLAGFQIRRKTTYQVPIIEIGNFTSFVDRYDASGNDRFKLGMEELEASCNLIVNFHPSPNISKGVGGVALGFPCFNPSWMRGNMLFPSCNVNDTTTAVPGTKRFLTFMHEIGHVLGLSHGHSFSNRSVIPGIDKNSTLQDRGEGLIQYNDFSIGDGVKKYCHQVMSVMNYAEDPRFQFVAKFYDRFTRTPKRTQNYFIEEITPRIVKTENDGKSGAVDSFTGVGYFLDSGGGCCSPQASLIKSIKEYFFNLTEDDYYKYRCKAGGPRGPMVLDVLAFQKLYGFQDVTNDASIVVYLDPWENKRVYDSKEAWSRPKVPKFEIIDAEGNSDDPTNLFAVQDYGTQASSEPGALSYEYGWSTIYNRTRGSITFDASGSSLDCIIDLRRQQAQYVDKTRDNWNAGESVEYDSSWIRSWTFDYSENSVNTGNFEYITKTHEEVWPDPSFQPPPEQTRETYVVGISGGMINDELAYPRLDRFSYMEGGDKYLERVIESINRGIPKFQEPFASSNPFGFTSPQMIKDLLQQRLDELPAVDKRRTYIQNLLAEDLSSIKQTTYFKWPGEFIADYEWFVDNSHIVLDPSNIGPGGQIELEMTKDMLTRFGITEIANNYIPKGGFSLAQSAYAAEGFVAKPSLDPSSNTIVFSNLGTEDPAHAFPPQVGNMVKHSDGTFTDDDGSVFPSNTIPKSVIYGGAGTTSVYYSLSADDYKYEFVDENNRETSDIEVRLASDTNNTGPYDLLVRSDPTRKVTNFGFPTGERDASGEMIFQIIAAESICLAEGTKITIYNPDKKCLDQVNVENLKEGDEVLTYKHGLVKVFSMVEDQFMHIKNPSFIHDEPEDLQEWTRALKIKNQNLYRIPKDSVPELQDDLYLTGGHSLLQPVLSKRQKREMNKVDWPEDYYKVDGLYKLLAHMHDHAEIVTKKKCKVYNIILEQDDLTDMHKNYAIIANGVMVESCNMQQYVNMKEKQELDRLRRKRSVMNSTII